MNKSLIAGAFLCLISLAVTLRAQSYGDRTLWLMNGSGAYTSSVNLGYADDSWHIAATGNFHGTGTAACDIVWENLETGDRLIWLMSGSTFSSAVFLPNRATNWRIVGAADFDNNGTSDIVWEDLDTGDRVVSYMTGTTITSFVLTTRS